MLNNNLSPEEILKEKEIRGGVQYDDPSSLSLEPANLMSNVYEEPQANDPTPDPVRKLESIRPPEPEFKEQAPLDLGWKNLPMGLLPSKGLFYPENTLVAIRSAEVKEIRQFSMVDEDDMLDIDAKLNFVLDSCCTIKFGGSGNVVSYKDLKQEDRFFVIMAIRDLTFVKGENRIILDGSNKCTTDGCKGMEAIELRTGVLSNYDLDEDLMKFY